MSLQMILQSSLIALIRQREHYVMRITEVNQQIIDLKKEAERNGVELKYDSKNP